MPFYKNNDFWLGLFIIVAGYFNFQDSHGSIWASLVGIVGLFLGAILVSKPLWLRHQALNQSNQHRHS